jgi:hypothetical protein
MVKVTTCFDTPLSSSRHYVRFLLFSIVIKSIYFYTLRRIRLKRYNFKIFDKIHIYIACLALTCWLRYMQLLLQCRQLILFSPTQHNNIFIMYITATCFGLFYRPSSVNTLHKTHVCIPLNIIICELAKLCNNICLFKCCSN